MFTSTVRSCSLRREFIKDIKRKISKTSSAPNSDAITSRKSNDQSNTVNSKWSRLNKHNNLRALSTLQAKIMPQSSTVSLVSKEEAREFMAVFPDIVRDLTAAGRHTDIPEVTKWYTKVLQHNVPNGKKNRGLAVVAAYKMLEDPNKLTPENVKLANIMGWCVEMFQLFHILTDDTVGSAQTRGDGICWYKDEEVGLKAMTDSISIEIVLNSVLQQYFSDSPHYAPALGLFRDALVKSAVGQTLEFFSKRDGRPDLDAFTMSRYNAIVKYRTAYYSFYLPVALGMYLASKYESETHRQARTILFEMGHFSQVQDDFLNCFGNSTIPGGNCTDIRDGKCSWLSVVALQRCSPSQRKVLQECYGRTEAEAVLSVKRLYEELGLPVTYSIYEEASYNLIRTRIQQISKGLSHEFFFKLMENIYGQEQEY